MKQNSGQVRVAIFGASLSGESASKHLPDNIEVVAFIDNDQKKQGRLLCGKPILGADKIEQLDVNKVLIASEFFEQINKQLIEIGIKVPIEILPARVIKPIQLQQSDRDGKTAVDILHLISKQFVQDKINHYIDAGTLLGVYRDDALIPWDDDLDFSIHGNNLPETIKSIERVLLKIQTLTNTQWTIHEYINKVEFGAVPVGAIRALKLLPNQNQGLLPGVDFFVKYLDGDTMDYCLSSRGFKMPSEHFKKTSPHPFSGGTVMLPFNVEKYLERHYGDWQTPNPDWNLGELKNTTVF